MNILVVNWSWYNSGGDWTHFENICNLYEQNNLHIALEAFSIFQQIPLVLVSYWSVSNYGIELKARYLNHPNLILLDAIYDKVELDFVRSNSYLNVHTHSRCGTAPSLAEAMCKKLPVLSYDVPTNRETMQSQGFYFQSSESLVTLLKSLSENTLLENAKTMHKIAQENYSWSKITNQYALLIKR